MAAKDRRKIIEDENYKMQLFNLNKWDIIRAKRESMLRQLNMLKFKIESKRKTKTHIVLNRILRTCYNNFLELKALKARQRRRLFAILLVTTITRAKMKQWGTTREERDRRCYRKVLAVGTQPMHDLFKLKAEELVRRFMIESADRYEKLSYMKTFCGRIILVQNAYRRRQRSKKTKR